MEFFQSASLTIDEEYWDYKGYGRDGQCFHKWRSRNQPWLNIILIISYFYFSFDEYFTSVLRRANSLTTSRMHLLKSVSSWSKVWMILAPCNLKWFKYLGSAESKSPEIISGIGLFKSFSAIWAKWYHTFVPPSAVALKIALIMLMTRFWILSSLKIIFEMSIYLYSIS